MNGFLVDDVDGLQAVVDDLSNVDTVIKTGRVMVDAILNGKISIAAQKHVPVKAESQTSRTDSNQ